MKVREFFTESTNMPPSDQRFRSYDHCKLEVLLEVNSRYIKLSGQIWILSPLPKEFSRNSEYQNPIKFHNLSNDG
jgi:hypothetical protein